MTEATVEARPKRMIIIDSIREGGMTAKDLMKAADCNAAGLASQFTYMRLVGDDKVGGTCPIKDADTDIYSLVTLEEWEQIKADKKANAGKNKGPAKTPEERLEAAIKREAKNKKTYETKSKAIEALDADKVTREMEIRCELADLNHELAVIELDAANVACPDGLPEVEGVEESTDEAPADLA